MARNFFLSREKTYIRKLNEILLALKIEREFTKDEILELYVNKFFLGQRAYGVGVGAAAQVYYGHPVSELGLAQLAMIAGLPKAPSRFNPVAEHPVDDRHVHGANLDTRRRCTIEGERVYESAVHAHGASQVLRISKNGRVSEIPV